MKRKVFRKRLVFAMAAIMAAASLLGGCGTAGTTAETTAETGTDKTAAAETGGTAADPFQFDSVSDVTFPLKEKLNMTVFVYATGTGGGTYQENYVTDWIEEKTNIHLDFVHDLDGEDAKTKLNLLMTDPESIPDILLATRWSKSEVQSYGQQGLVMPLNDLLKDAPNWNKLNELCPARKADLTMPDGNVYTYGDVNECFHLVHENRMWIYKPWVDKLNGGKMPETTEELYEFLQKVKTQDPNGNGIADEIPMTGYIGGWASDPTVWMINSFVQCLNPLSDTEIVVGSGLTVNNGKIEYAVMKDEYREALRYINRLYKEGLLDNQTFTQDLTQFLSALNNEETNLVGLHPGGALQADGDNHLAKKPGRWQDWEILEPVAGPEGVRLATRGITDYFAACVGSISANCKYPEIAVALFDFLATEEGTNVQSFGPEGVGWEWTTEGTSLAGGTPSYQQLTIPEDYDWLGNGFARDYEYIAWGSDASIKANTAEYRGELRISEPDYDMEYLLQESAEKYDKYTPAADTLVPNLVFEGQDAQTISEGSLTIGGYVNQATVQFITGALDVDKDWDTYLQKLENMGVQNFLEIYQDYYDAYMETAAQ